MNRRVVVVSGVAALVLLAGCAPPASVQAARSNRAPTAGAAGRPAPAFQRVRAAPKRPQPVQASTPSHLRGSDGWKLTKPADSGQVAGYTDRVSGLPGTVVGLRVSTTAPSYRVRAYRVGAYRGGTGRLVWTSARLPGVHQAHRVFRPYSLRTVVAPWHDTLRVRTTGWDPGAYLFQITDSSGWQAAAPYVVDSPSVAGRVVLVVPVTTWQAYNDWGGYSLYHGVGSDQRSYQVSFDRPYQKDGMGEFGFTIAPVAVQAERTGVPLAYLTDVDLDEHPSALAGAAGYVDAGHSEYWSNRMRHAVEGARRNGTNEAFLAANTSYWRVRLHSSPTGPDRLVVGYKTDSGLDPANRTRPKEVTGRFRDPPAPDPENRLTGMLYECFPADAPYHVETPHWWGFRGTGVRAGTDFPHLVGNEADRVYPIAGTPHPLQILSNASYLCDGAPTSAQSVYWTDPSGAGVVAVGTLRWTCSLIGNCFGEPMDARTVRFVSRVTRTIVTEFARGPLGFRFAAHDNVSRFSLPKVNQVPAS